MKHIKNKNKTQHSKLGVAIKTVIDNFHFNMIFKIKQVSNLTFGDIHATPLTSGMDPLGIFLDGFQPLGLLDTS